MSDSLTNAIKESVEFEHQKEIRLLRDQIAMSALQGLLSKHGIAESGFGTIAPDHNAKLAYIMADEMLRARNAKD